jgi:hypothetical protein
LQLSRREGEFIPKREGLVNERIVNDEEKKLVEINEERT